MITTALVLNEIGKPFALEEIQVDALRPDEALVEIHATGICHTDLSIANGTIPATVPAILGHEGAGVVTQVGADVPGFAPGDKVVLSFSHCRICNQCKAGFPSYCYSFPARNFGGKRDDGSTTLRKTDAGGGRGCFSGFFGQSSFSRLAVVSGSSMVKVPASTNLALCSPLGCGLQTGAGAVLNKLNVQSGSSVAVFGVGAVGMSAVMASKMRNAKVIVAVDVQQSRLDLALKLGATHAFLGNDPDIVKKIHEAALPMGVNYAVECSGVPAVTDIMYHSLDNRGHGTAVGAPAVCNRIEGEGY